MSWAPDLFGRSEIRCREYQAAAQVSAADLENERLLEQATLAEIYFEIRGAGRFAGAVERDGEGRRRNACNWRRRVTRWEPIPRFPSSRRSKHWKARGPRLQTLAWCGHNMSMRSRHCWGRRRRFCHAGAGADGAAAGDSDGDAVTTTGAAAGCCGGGAADGEANALIGIGYAAYYPSVTLSASGGFSSSAISKLFRGVEPDVVDWWVGIGDIV